MIYLDNAATTKPFKSVTQIINRYYESDYFNPSALYSSAVNVAADVNRAREIIGGALGGGGRVIFTSCATESNAWVFACGAKNKKGNIVVTYGEHASVYESAVACSNKGYDVRFAKLLPNGEVDENDLLSKTDANTTLVSIIHCSNETGAINNLKLLTPKIRAAAPNALIHSDGVQAFGKISANCRSLGIDLYSISAHKIGGCKGIGGLWIKDGIRLNPLLCGGGQEYGYRSGTENVAAIMGFAQAYKEFSALDSNKIQELRSRIIFCLRQINGVTVNEGAIQSPFILSFSAAGVKAEVIQRMLAEQGVIIGLGSACASRHKKNRVLAAMGRSMSDIEGSMRISFSSCNLADDINYACKKIEDCINRFRTK